MKLRAHHLLCLPQFVGEGYSGAFTENMARCKGQLEKEGRFTLALGADDICAACPERRGEGCAAGAKPLRYDAAVIEALGLRPGEDYAWGPLAERLRAALLRPEALSGICGDCQWHALCREILERGKP